MKNKNTVLNVPKLNDFSLENLCLIEENLKSNIKSCRKLHKLRNLQVDLCYVQREIELRKEKTKESTK